MIMDLNPKPVSSSVFKFFPSSVLGKNETSPKPCADKNTQEINHEDIDVTNDHANASAPNFASDMFSRTVSYYSSRARENLKRLSSFVRDTVQASASNYFSSVTNTSENPMNISNWHKDISNDSDYSAEVFLNETDVALFAISEEPQLESLRKKTIGGNNGHSFRPAIGTIICLVVVSIYLW
jgi:hypothetical protein